MQADVWLYNDCAGLKDSRASFVALYLLCL